MFTWRNHEFRKDGSWSLCVDCGRPRQDIKHYNAPEGWKPMELAPKNATNVEVILSDGQTLIAHWAEDLSGEDQPPFRGWFRVVKSESGKVDYFRGIDEPKGWRPLAKGVEE